MASSSYDAFNTVDKLVSKPVLGSDGAAAWQDFRSNVKGKKSGASVAPTAPLKKADRAVGFSSWDEERRHEADVRKQSGAAILDAGYTEFRQKHDGAAAVKRKERERIERRIRPDDRPYFIGPKSTFEGWKFDYVFTTKEGRGTGYYWDGMDSLKRLKGEEQGISSTTDDEPAVTEFEGMAGKDTVQGGGIEEGGAGKPNKKKKKRKRTEQKGPTIVHNPSNPREQMASFLQRRRDAAAIASTQSSQQTWETAVDKDSGRTYYFCRVTGLRQWEDPRDVTAASKAEAAPAEAAAAAKAEAKTEAKAKSEDVSSHQQEDPLLPKGWSQAKDHRSGQVYYYHSESGETQWERPSA